MIIFSNHKIPAAYPVHINKLVLAATCHNEAINQGGTDDKRNNFDQIAVTYPSEGVEEYLPEAETEQYEAETEQYEAESEPEYEKEEDYVMGYLSWYTIRIVVILCYVLFRYMSQA